MPNTEHLEKVAKEQSEKSKLAQQRMKEGKAPFSNSEGLICICPDTNTKIVRSDGNGGKYIVFHS